MLFLILPPSPPPFHYAPLAQVSSLLNNAHKMNPKGRKVAIRQLALREQNAKRTFEREKGAATVKKLGRIGQSQGHGMARRADSYADPKDLAAARSEHLARRRELVAARATVDSLKASTGISAAAAAGAKKGAGSDGDRDATYGHLFRILNRLFEGQVPAEALGVSAKFFKDGTAQTGRYHVALQPPCGCWSLERGAVRDAAAEAAGMLQAPQLVQAWLDEIFASTDDEETLPSLGFGVSKDDGAAKVRLLREGVAVDWNRQVFSRNRTSSFKRE